MKLNLRDLGFHWRGKDKDGVSKWTGSVKPLYWTGIICSIYGPIAGILVLSAAFYALLFRHLTEPAMTLIGVGLIHFVLFAAIGQWALAMRRHVLRLKPAEEVSAELGVDAAALRELAEQRSIKPRIILNDKPYYDPTEFVDALSLLRASSARQADPGSLLHAAAGPQSTPSGDLLTTAPMTQPTVAATQETEIQCLSQ